MNEALDSLYFDLIVVSVGNAVFLNVTIYEAELENGSIVRITKSEKDEDKPQATIKFSNTDCVQDMNRESSQKWYEHLKPLTQKQKLP